MPLPLGHAAIGLVTLDVVSKDKSFKTWLLSFLVVVFLANLPDIDVFFGLLYRDNGGFFHRGPTHSILFSFVIGFLASNMFKLWPALPRLSFLDCTLIILSHVLADLYLTDSAVSLLWPLEIHFAPGITGWGDVMNKIVFEAHQDIGIFAFSATYLCFKYGQDRVRFFSKLAGQTFG